MTRYGHDPRYERRVTQEDGRVRPAMPSRPVQYWPADRRERPPFRDGPAGPISSERERSRHFLREEDVVRRRPQQDREDFSVRWTVVSALTLCTGLGLTAVAAADNLSTRGYTYHTTSAFFWLGLLLIFVPIASRVLMRAPDRRERLGLIILLGVALYLVKILGSPDGFTNFDEYIHWRNTIDILQTHHLFSYNPLLPTAAYYPGIAAVTAGLGSITGLNTFVSGLIVVGVARVLISASFFLIAESVTGSPRAASLASLIYATNPMFLFWSSSFAYEDLALPLAAFVIWWFGRTRNNSGLIAPTVVIISVAATIVTHHVVSLMLAGLLVVWWLIERFVLHCARTEHSLGLVALVSTSGALIWVFLVARPAAAYLFTSNIAPALDQTISLIFHHGASRQLYSSGGYVSPKWETLAGFAAVGLLVGALPFGLYMAWHVASRRSRAARARLLSRGRAPLIIAVIIAIAYPLSLVPRLAPGGVAISGRSSEYVFAGLGCVLGLFAEVSVWRWPGEFDRLKNLLAMLCKTPVIICIITVVFVGNITIGTAFYERLPESSNPPGYPWTVQPDAIAASIWMLNHLGANQRVGTDANDSLALATYGDQNTLQEEAMWPIFFASTMNETVVQDIKADKVNYVLVDWRMTLGVPPTPGYYFSPQETSAGDYSQPFPAAGLRKFTSNCTRLIYKSGDIEIFDLSRIANGSCVPASGNSHKEGSKSS